MLTAFCDTLSPFWSAELQPIEPLVLTQVDSSLRP
jgi:hypothetical protein